KAKPLFNGSYARMRSRLGGWLGLKAFGRDASEIGAMRSSQNVLFPWAYQDRAQELSRFREFASRWRPVVRCKRDEDDFDEFAPFDSRSSSADRVDPVPRPTWSPWLWVK